LKSPSQGRIAFDRDTRQAWIDGKQVAFGDKCFDLLAVFLEATTPLSAKELHRRAWPGHEDRHVVNVTIPRLRKCLEPFEDFQIESSRHGYRLVTGGSV